MILQTQPNLWTCLPTSLAMLLSTHLDEEVTLHDIIQYVGHDGGEVFEPELGIPDGCVGINVRELQDYCFVKHHLMLTPIYFNKDWFPPESVKTTYKDLAWWLERKNAVICGTIWNKAHAVMWNMNKKLIYDPTGTTYPIDADIGLKVDLLLVVS